MQLRKVIDLLVEGDEYQKRARNETQLSRSERQHLYAKAEFLFNHVLEFERDDTLEGQAAIGALGELYLETGKWGLGLTLLKAACRAEPNEASLWNSLGVGYRKINNVEWAREAFQKALGLVQPGKEHDRQRSQIMHNMATTYINEGEPAKAIEWDLKAMEFDPAQDAFKFNMGLAYLELGEFGKGWDGYELGRRADTWDGRNYSHPADPAKNRPARTVVDWDGSPGKNLVVFGEQGVGDEILFAHALRDTIDISKHVIIDCHPRLVNLFKRSYPECSVYGTRKDDDITWPADHEIDAKVPFGSLHRFFRRRVEDFPVYHAGYIKPDPALVEQFRGKPGAGLRVGLSWIGGTKSTHVALRSIPLEKLAPILSVPDVEFVSLQYTEKAGEEVAKARETHGWNISHDDEMNADLDKLFACMKGLDLVITVLTSNVHFAGSMNVPTWILTPIKAPWQFCQETMPWYTKSILLRQKEHGEWGDVIETISRRLAMVARSRRIAAE